MPAIASYTLLPLPQNELSAHFTPQPGEPEHPELRCGHSKDTKTDTNGLSVLQRTKAEMRRSQTILRQLSRVRTSHGSANKMAQNDTIPIKDYRLGNHDVFYVPNFLSVEEERYILHTRLTKTEMEAISKQKATNMGWRDHGQRVIPAKPPVVYDSLVDRLKKTGVFVQSPHQQPNHVILNEYQPGQGIMPHQDGPKYFPVVATVSLGSHAVFNYFRYKAEDVEAEDGVGKAVEEVPMLSLLLEPRSLIVSCCDMYTSNLHGIDSLEEDNVFPSVPAMTVSAKENLSLNWVPGGVTPIDNWEMLGDEVTKQFVAKGAVLKRGTRYSLTFRDVERITSAKSFKFI
ncbi:hypothetical protein D9756_008041 [Leucocoprinus leucothites]|uniref:Fe2OG dioxygenase domain-containing protein n=1 Tax=Leucocoprinus leucothites TaxID=201217 RepID=A0A8H5D4X8_9AGAR|nr:hypothetical protein D9756_008041 [Leucoagaricus leucothites]